MSYDSTVDTLKHSRRVGELMVELIIALSDRSVSHDLSKTEEPELSIFNEYAPKLSNSTYGDKEYFENLENMKVALEHHYKYNRHHPEHFDNGINGMTLVDLIEMLADWKASTERHEDGNIRSSLDIQGTRFDISDQLMNILRNTIEYYGWDE